MSLLPKIRAFTGPQTTELLRSPARFGLGQLPASLQPDATTNAVCGFCSTGCSLKIHMKDGQAINLSPDTDYPVNTGMACPKGWEALAPLSAPDRAVSPVLDGSPVDWDTAMRAFCDRIRATQEKHGPDSVAFLSTGQICTEEMAFLGALAKFGMGIRHGDGNTRQCMATAATAYKQSFGFDAPPYTYQDFEESDVILLIGSNLCVTHPIMWQRVLRNKNNPRILVFDPRKTETAMFATNHVALQPKSDLVLLYTIAHILIRENWIDQTYIDSFTNDFEDFSRHVSAFSPETTKAITGLTPEQTQQIAATIHEGKRVSFWWTMGINQGYEATRTAQAIINLALMTGNIGRPGTGANSITGQCNAMGSRLFSNTTGLPGGRDYSNPAHRKEVAEIMGIQESSVPAENCMAYDQIMDGIADGRIKALWVIATNTAHTWTNQRKSIDALKQLDFLVVQDMYHNTETAELADLILPAAGWGEKEGTFINSERRIGLVKKVSRAPGQALSDFNIFKLIANYWSTKTAGSFASWTDPESAFRMLARLSRNRPCDFSGIKNYRQIDEQSGIQWPFPDEVTSNESQRRLFENGRYFHSDGKARFIFAKPAENPELPDKDYPFILLTGRGTSAQWHTQTRTGKSEVLGKLHPKKVYAEINPDDAREHEIRPHQTISVQSRRGELKVTAFITPTVRPGQIFIPMHYFKMNRLTHPAVDPHSRQPNYKSCAVKVVAACD